MSTNTFVITSLSPPQRSISSPHQLYVEDTTSWVVVPLLCKYPQASLWGKMAFWQQGIQKVYCVFCFTDSTKSARLKLWQACFIELEHLLHSWSQWLSATIVFLCSAGWFFSLTGYTPDSSCAANWLTFCPSECSICLGNNDWWTGRGWWAANLLIPSAPICGIWADLASTQNGIGAISGSCFIQAHYYL